MPRTEAFALVAWVIGLTACDDGARAIDPFPVRVDLSAGPVMMGALSNLDETTEPRPAVVDTLAPVTVLDPFAPGEPLPSPHQTRVELTLFGLDDTGLPTVPRVRFPDTAAFELHPCAGPEDGSDCVIGVDDLTVPVRAIVGADVLARSAVRFDFERSSIRFFPDTAGSDAERGDECQAVFSGTFHGGGTLLIAGTETPYAGDRPTAGVCLSPPSDIGTGLEGDYAGVDALVVISTGIGMSVLSASAYDRYTVAVETAVPRADLPPATLQLPSGPISAKVAEIPSVALVGEESDVRGPCLELLANKVMTAGGCKDSGVEECPCEDPADDFCRTAAAVDLAEVVRFAIIEDTEPLLQALRDELRPDLPELDGVLGVDALRPVVLELDYENGRMLFSCRDESICLARPQVRSRTDSEQVAQCL